MNDSVSSPKARAEDQRTPRNFACVHDEELDALPPELQATRPKGTIGLALSGGGIRSATFNLGVLEALRSRGLLEQIHYLSTVSGGGYIGAWLTANCHPERRGRDWLRKAADWSQSIRYLRRYSNYLSPQVGFFSADTWAMGCIWMRNALLVQLTVILLLATVLLLPPLLHDAFLRWPGANHFRYATFALFLLSVVGISGNQLRLSYDGGFLLRRGHWASSTTASAILLFLSFLAARNFEPFTGQAVNEGNAIFIALTATLGCFFLQQPVVKLIHFIGTPIWGKERTPAQINYTQAWTQALVVVPLLASAFLVSSVMWHQSVTPPPLLQPLTTYSALLRHAHQQWIFPLSFIFAALSILAFCSISHGNRKRGSVAALFSAIVCTGAFYAMMCALMLLLRSWAGHTISGSWLALLWAPLLVLSAFTTTVILLIGLMGRDSTEDVREWWSRLGAWLSIYGCAWVIVAIASIHGPRWTAMLFTGDLWQGLSLSGGWIATTAAGLLAGNAERTGSRKRPEHSNRLLEAAARIAPFVFIGGLLLLVTSVLHLILLKIAGIEWNSAQDLTLNYWKHLDLITTYQVLAVLVCVATALVLFAARVDINEFSLNAFYRNRLVRCYLGASRDSEQRSPQNFTGFDGNDDLPLHDLATSHRYKGPIHLVNCALNLGGSGDLELHTRQCANFTFSPQHCGSNYLVKSPYGNRHINYLPTDIYGGTQHPTLGEVISISGAAASPNMGSHTSPVVAFLMTMFNVRLGGWFPRPETRLSQRPSPPFSLRYLISELFGGADCNRNYLMLSDGGHFENLAVYELVRRRCKVIIACDAECDGDLEFGSLGSLIRMCDTDLNASIDLDVSAIRRDPPDSGYSRSHCAVGTITYGDGTVGTLIYIKASLTGKEDTAVQQYAASHSAFPHESTGDQFYTEDQFESYRRLGAKAAAETFDPAGVSLADLHAAARNLHCYWSPSESLDRLATRDRLTVMEHAVLTLGLDESWLHPDVKGWRTRFMVLIESPDLEEAWAQAEPNLNPRFQSFFRKHFAAVAKERANGGAA